MPQGDNLTHSLSSLRAILIDVCCLRMTHTEADRSGMRICLLWGEVGSWKLPGVLRHSPMGPSGLTRNGGNATLPPILHDGKFERQSGTGRDGNIVIGRCDHTLRIPDFLVYLWNLTTVVQLQRGVSEELVYGRVTLDTISARPRLMIMQQGI